MTQSATNKYYVYVGTSRGDRDEGIYIYTLDMETGALQRSGVVGGVHNPSFLAIHPTGRFLYAIDEDRSESESEGGVSAFAIDAKTGSLTHINRQASQGQGLCHVFVDRDGRNLLTAHYGGGSISVLPILADGSLGEASEVIQHEGSSVHPRQTAAHPHSIFLDPDNAFAFVPDLGLDKIMIYRFLNDSGRLIPNETPWVELAPGSGPRHFAFHPDGQLAYVINELASTITAFNYDSNVGVLTEFQTITTLPEDFEGESWTAEILVHPTGKFVYGSNRGHDSIAIFNVDPANGRLTLVGFEPTQGGHPRNFAMEPTGTYLYAENRDSDNIVAFRIDQETGMLQPTGHVTNIPRPVCIKMLPA